MLWFVLSLCTAVFSAIEAAVTKRWLGHLSRCDMLVCLLGWSWPFFALYILWMGWQPLASGFWSNLLFLLPLNVIGTFVQYEAIRSAPLSLTMPFMAFTPAFMIITGFVFLGELPSLPGLVGILLIVFGCWVLNADGSRSLVEPFRAIFRERGSRYALYASIIWAVGAVICKRMALAGDPLFAGAVFFCIHNAVVVLGIVLLGRSSFQVLLRHPLAGLVSGLALVAHIAFHYTAITMIAAAYMIAIKRLNGIISVVIGGAFFGDTNLRSRFAGAVVMAAGAGIIGIWG